MLLPILTIFVCNSIIISKIIKKSSLKRERNPTVNNNSKKQVNLINHISCNGKNSNINKIKLSGIDDFKIRIKPYYLNMNQIINKITEKANNPKKLTRMLLVISFSNVFLNLPYFIFWTLNYYEIMIRNGETLIERNSLYSALKISEIFYLISFGVFFYIYYASGSVFRNQVKYSSNLF